MPASRTPRAEPTPWLLLVAGLFVLAGASIHLVACAESGRSADWRGIWRATLADWGSLWLFASAGVGVLALSLTLISWSLPAAQKRQRELAELHARGLGEKLEELRQRAEAAVTAGSVSRALDELLFGAVGVGASDLHLSPGAGGLRVTCRMDGTLHELCVVPGDVGQRLVARSKVLSQLDPFLRGPQDGKLRHRVGTRHVEARVSCLPVDHGQRVVLRFVRSDSQIPALSELGLSSDLVLRLSEVLSKPEGMLVVSGPVGSGKTTTLYSALQHIQRRRGNLNNIVTLEDPIEMQLPFATQTQINRTMGMDFAHALRSALRQDPNVLMVGEIRDEETAKIAAQSGLTGHLILTTMHVDSAAGTFARLTEMRVEPFVVASTAAGALAQRLLRQLCTHCRAEMPPEAELQRRFAALGVELPAGCYFEPTGCDICDGHGYAGRFPVAELLIPSASIREAINAKKDSASIGRLAREQGMTSLLDGALDQARAGRTSLSEVIRVAG